MFRVELQIQILHFGPLMSCFRCFDILFARSFVCTVGADADEIADEAGAGDGDAVESLSGYGYVGAEMRD